METSVWSLWLPILVSGVVLFFASWLAWMVLPHHKGDWKGVPNEDSFAKMVREGNIAPGQYMFPYAATPEEWKSEAVQARVKSGPTGLLYVWPGHSNMGVNLFCTWLLFTVLSFVIAYLAGMVIPPGADAWPVFRFTSTAGLLTYAASGLLNAIWFRRKIWGDILDGIAYAAITGALFAWLWPGTAQLLPKPAMASPVFNGADDQLMPNTIGYHLVKSAYGMWLPGDTRGHWSSVWDEQIGYYEPHHLHSGDPVRQRMARERMNYSPTYLSPLMIDAVARAVGYCANDSDWNIAAAAIESTHMHRMLTYTERDIDRTAKWIAQMTTKEVHATTNFAGPVWCEGKWLEFIFDHNHWENLRQYIERHNRRRGLPAQPWGWITP